MDQTGAIWMVPIWHQTFWPACLGLINAIFNPHAAVILFFILSGHVLTQSLGDGKTLSGKGVASFYLKRCFRILPMMWAALLFTYALSKINHKSPDSQASIFYVSMFEHPPHLIDLLRNFLLVDFNVSPVTWTMRIELLGSLAMPAIVYFLSHSTRTRRLVMLALLCALPYMTHSDFQYLVCFYVGALLTSRDLAVVCASRPDFLVVCGMVICTAIRLITYLNNHPTIVILAGTLGAALVLLGVLAGPSKFAILESGPFRWVGRLSYSLYLLHPPFLGICAVAFFAMGVYPLLSGAAANTLLFFTSVIAALAGSACSYRLIEQPAIALGKRTTKFASR
jgi:peptidoglycan/LPS O-acetylase OafA/YrhL